MNNHKSKIEDSPANVRFTFSAVTLEAIEYLKQASNTSSLAGVIRDALIVYRWAIGTVQQGGVIVVMDRKGALKKVTLPQLERTAAVSPVPAAHKEPLRVIPPRILYEEAKARRS